MNRAARSGLMEPADERMAAHCWLLVRWHRTLALIAAGGDVQDGTRNKLMLSLKDHRPLQYVGEAALYELVDEAITEATTKAAAKAREVLVGLFNDYKEARRAAPRDGYIEHLAALDRAQWDFQAAAEALGFCQEDLDEYSGTKSAVQMLQTRTERDAEKGV